MDFSRGADGEPRQQFQHAATSASAFTNPTPPSGGAGDLPAPPSQRADDPHVKQVREINRQACADACTV